MKQKSAFVIFMAASLMAGVLMMFVISIAGTAEDPNTDRNSDIHTTGSPIEDARSSSRQNSIPENDTEIGRGKAIYPRVRESDHRSSSPYLEPSKADPLSPESGATGVDPVVPVVEIAASVRPVCGAPKSGIDCEDEERLQRFRAERRDVQWAFKIENALQRMVEIEIEEFTIRGLECRSTLCLLEVESPAGELRRKLEPEAWRSLRVEPIGVRTGHERRPHELPITVSLWIYERNEWAVKRSEPQR